ncbi:TatD family hydrolase [Fulvivirgaceae bacterium BMA10]|uniref:TatD family hydrolase n=1 Tax=Splendidivirga corallicola TaxID=3051826 RepID=A0ABT8KQA1_9BACT|nr:TatD family hydrolase [Fulvivirgaceae bacterium BMA10]
MKYVDTHAHIYLKDFKKDLDDIIDKSVAAGVDEIYMPNIDHTSIDDMLEVEARYPKRCFAMMGLHPCSVKRNFEKELYLVEEWLAKRDFLAVGEIGIDLYWDKTFQGAQEEAFKIQIAFAKKHQLPIVIHCRESFDVTISLVEDLYEKGLTGVFHCFGGSVEDAKRVIALGFYIGIGGVATFKNGGLDKVLPEINLDHVILETDSPYLAPVPHRGKRNEPSYVPLVARRIAELKNIDVDEVAEKTTLNAEKLFVKHWKLKEN